MTGRRQASSCHARIAAVRPTIALAGVALLAIGLPAMAAAQIEIQVQADAPGRDDRNLNGEYVLVSNEGNTPVDISGWRLCNAVLDCFVFPEGATIGPGGDLRAFTGSGRDAPLRVYMRRTLPLWADWSDIATLTDRAGDVRARCVWDRGRGIDCSPP